MDYNETKKNMTQGEWSSENMPEYVPGKEMEANMEATCTAINNTYGKGINPEAVGELRYAIILYLVTYADTDTNPTASQENNVVIAMRQAIAHARGAK